MVLIGFKGQKNTFFRVQRSKEHFLPGSKVEKTFSLIFPLSRSMSKNMVLVGFKGQKNILYDFSTFTFCVEKSGSWSGSNVKKHGFLPGSKVKKTLSTLG
jgi:hypothetical protein